MKRMRSSTASMQRRHLLKSICAIWSASAGTIAAEAAHLPHICRETAYLATVADRLGLNTPAFFALAARLHTALPEDELTAISTAVTLRLRSLIGSVLGSATATLPAVVTDDFALERVRVVAGIAFSHTELALLNAVAVSGRHPTADGTLGR